MATGVATGVAAGNATAQATYLAVTGSLPLTVSAGALPGAPGWCGFGTDSRFAYGLSPGTQPNVLKVTKLTDDGSVGTLRWALLSSGPRVIVFEVSGTITLGSDIYVTEPYVTVAGQTAPSPGITIKGFSPQMLTHDWLLWHLRIRPGDGPPLLAQTADHDGPVSYYASSYNGVIANCSVSWAGHDLTGVYKAAPGAGFTYWRNIFSESLYRAANITPQGGSWSAGPPSSINMLLKQPDAVTPTNVSVIQNLFAHNSDRNPEIQNLVNAHIINNVIFDWGKDANTYPWGVFIYWESGPVPTLVDVIGNRFIAGSPDARTVSPLVAVQTWNTQTGTAVYVSDSSIDSALQSVTAYAAHGTDPAVGSPPVSLTGITVRSSTGLEAFLLPKVGARPADRDSVDTRIVAETLARTGTVISSQNAVGGWPTLAINARAYSVPASPHTVQASGYTALEEQLQRDASSVEN